MQSNNAQSDNTSARGRSQCQQVQKVMDMSQARGMAGQRFDINKFSKEIVQLVQKLKSYQQFEKLEVDLYHLIKYHYLQDSLRFNQICKKYKLHDKLINQFKSICTQIKLYSKDLEHIAAMKPQQNKHLYLIVIVIHKDKYSSLQYGEKDSRAIYNYRHSQYHVSIFILKFQKEDPIKEFFVKNQQSSIEFKIKINQFKNGIGLEIKTFVERSDNKKIVVNIALINACLFGFKQTCPLLKLTIIQKFGQKFKNIQSNLVKKFIQSIHQLCDIQKKTKSQIEMMLYLLSYKNEQVLLNDPKLLKSLNFSVHQLFEQQMGQYLYEFVPIEQLCYRSLLIYVLRDQQKSDQQIKYFLLKYIGKLKEQHMKQAIAQVIKKNKKLVIEQNLNLTNQLLCAKVSLPTYLHIKFHYFHQLTKNKKDKDNRSLEFLNQILNIINYSKEINPSPFESLESKYLQIFSNQQVILSQRLHDFYVFAKPINKHQALKPFFQKLFKRINFKPAFKHQFNKLIYEFLQIPFQNDIKASEFQLQLLMQVFKDKQTKLNKQLLKQFITLIFKNDKKQKKKLDTKLLKQLTLLYLKQVYPLNHQDYKYDLCVVALKSLDKILKPQMFDLQKQLEISQFCQKILLCFQVFIKNSKNNVKEYLETTYAIKNPQIKAKMLKKIKLIFVQRGGYHRKSEGYPYLIDITKELQGSASTIGEQLDNIQQTNKQICLKKVQKLLLQQPQLLDKLYQINYEQLSLGFKGIKSKIQNSQYKNQEIQSIIRVICQQKRLPKRVQTQKFIPQISMLLKSKKQNIQQNHQQMYEMQVSSNLSRNQQEQHHQMSDSTN